MLAVLAATVVALGACSDDKATREGGDITEAGPISVFELRPGDCLYPDEEVVGEVENIQAVPCDEPHLQEVFAVTDYPDEEGGGVYPGEAAIQQYADAACVEAFETYTGTDYVNSDLFLTYLHPSVDSWNDDDRQIICVLTDEGREMTGSQRATTTTTARDGSGSGGDEDEGDTTSTTEADEADDEE